MGKSKSPKAAQESHSLEGVVVDLTDEVKSLAGNVEVLRIAVDDLRHEVETVLRHLSHPQPPPSPPLTSFPKDPCAPDFGKRINRVKRTDLPDSEPDAEPGPSQDGGHAGQGTLWEECSPA